MNAPASETAVGVLLAQLGTPASPSTRDVRRYLREFLSDPRVIDLPAPARWLFVNGVIAPFRAPRSARAYRAIWLREGSPLRVHGEALAAELARTLGPDFAVELGMRYGAPSLGAALDRLASTGAKRDRGRPALPAGRRVVAAGAHSRRWRAGARASPRRPS